MGGPFGLANATDSKKKATLIGRSYLPSASDASIQPAAKVGESKVESGLSVLNEWRFPQPASAVLLSINRDKRFD